MSSRSLQSPSLIKTVLSSSMLVRDVRQRDYPSRFFAPPYPKLTRVNGFTLTMQKGHISLTLYPVIEHLVTRGEVELV